MAMPALEQTVDHAAVIERISSILRADTYLNKEIAEWRLGDVPERTMAKAFPCIYVTTADRPQSSRRMIGPAASVSALPSQSVTTDLLVTILSNTGDAWATQRQIYDIQRRIDAILARNVQLRRPRAQFDDPLCQTLEIDSIPRLTSNRGQLLDGLTVMLRLYNVFVRQPAA